MFSAPVVIDHIGRMPAGLGVAHPGFQTLLSLLQQGNCWAKLSGAYLTSAQAFPFEDVVPMAKALVEVAPRAAGMGKRLASPVLQDGDTCRRKPVGHAGNLGPHVKTRNRILVDNAAELYGFSS